MAGEYTSKRMIPSGLQSLFWEVDVDRFSPEAYPDYTIFRVLEFGDQEAFAWLKQIFPESEIRRVLSTERRLSPKSATFWALVYGVPAKDVASLNDGR